MKKLEAKLRLCLVLGTFLATLARNHHLAFSSVFKTPNREVRYAIVLHGKYRLSQEIHIKYVYQ